MIQKKKFGVRAPSPDKEVREPSFGIEDSISRTENSILILTLLDETPYVLVASSPGPGEGKSQWW